VAETSSQNLSALIRDADSSLIDAIGYTNAASFIARALEQQTRGKEVDEALHSLQLVIKNALGAIGAARSQLEIMEDLTPADNSNDGDN
jgi:DNA repair ATPase RecN